MIKYKLQESGVQDIETTAFIPNDPKNTDWQEYQKWLAEGNIPIPLPPSPYYDLIGDEWVHDPVAEAEAAAYEQKHIWDLALLLLLDMNVRPHYPQECARLKPVM